MWVNYLIAIQNLFELMIKCFCVYKRMSIPPRGFLTHNAV